VNVETEDSPEISDSGAEISDMFLRKFILYQTNVQIIWRYQNILSKMILTGIFRTVSLTQYSATPANSGFVLMFLSYIFVKHINNV